MACSKSLFCQAEIGIATSLGKSVKVIKPCDTLADHLAFGDLLQRVALRLTHETKRGWQMILSPCAKKERVWYIIGQMPITVTTGM